ncbi:unnamed protein product [Nesidiocoris tenuis]|uniref:Uncharacterized protein n=1 Tax=Nesidiocoris tenuis TaxID=355587 RepID=A0A6H5I033_9HEMI|nr:unnamed protein product [Nesidiocoris tenuis]
MRYNYFLTIGRILQFQRERAILEVPVKTHNTKVQEDKNKLYTMHRYLLLIQGVPDNSADASTRIGHVAVLMISFLIGVYYNTAILNGLILQAPNGIQTVDQLLRSDYRLAVQDMPYLRFEMARLPLEAGRIGVGHGAVISSIRLYDNRCYTVYCYLFNRKISLPQTVSECQVLMSRFFRFWDICPMCFKVSICILPIGVSLADAVQGSTALHIASMHRQPSVVELLLNKGADFQIKDSTGRTPLDVAGLGTYAQKKSETPVSTPIITRTAPEYPASQSFPKPTLYSMPAYAQSPEQELPPADGSFIPASFFPAPSPPVTPVKILPPRTASAYEPIGMEAVGVSLNTALINIVNSFLNSGAKIVKDETDSGSALHSAILSEEYSVIKFLLEQGADLDAYDSNGDTPLHLAVRQKNPELVQTIIAFLKDGEIDMKNKEGVPALFLAVSSDWRAGVTLLLENGASVTTKSDSRETVFHIAAKLGDQEMMKELLSEKGADEVLQDKDAEGLTPLHRAIQTSSLPVVKELVNIARVNLGVLLDNGSNIIHFTVSQERDSDKNGSNVLKFLLENNVCVKLVNDINPFDGLAALHIAAEKGDVNSVKLLLKAGAQANLKSADEYECTALHLAAKNGFRKTILILLEHDQSSLNIEDSEKWKPIHAASFWGHGKCAIEMIRYGADLSDTILFHGSTKTALDLLVTNVPKTAELLEELLDDYIIIDPKKQQKLSKFLNDPKCKITLDFSILLSADDPAGRQLMFLDSLLDSNSAPVKELLLHPLIEIFLYLKWEKLWKFFAILLGVYLLHISAFTAFCIMIFIEHYNSVVGKNILQLTFSVSLVPILVAELLQFLRLERRYWNDPESWLKWTMIFTSGAVGCCSLFLDEFEWMKHIASLAILTSWIELLFLFSRFRYWGLDVLMFEKVIENVVTGRVERLVKRTSFLSFLETLVYHERLNGCLHPSISLKKGRTTSFRSVDSMYEVQPNKPGSIPHVLKAALVQKVIETRQTPEKSESALNLEKLGTSFSKIELKMQSITDQLETLQNKLQQKQLKNRWKHGLWFHTFSTAEPRGELVDNISENDRVYVLAQHVQQEPVAHFRSSDDGVDRFSPN